MERYTYIKLTEKPELKDKAASWFHQKWGVPKEEYLKCMEAYLNSETEYGWEFLCMVQGDGEDHPSRMYIHRGK